MMDARRTGRSPAKVVVSLPLSLALAAGCLLLSGCKAGADLQQKPVVAGCATSTAVKSPKELALAGFLSALKLEGKPVLIEFGMVGCVLSGQGLDSMIALQAAGVAPGLAFVRVEGNPDAAVVAQYFKDKAPPFPVYLDSGSALAKALSATAYPTFLLVDKFGHIRYQGNYPQENLVQWGKALVAENRDPGGSVPQFGRREMDIEKLMADKLPDLKDEMRPLSEYKGSGGLVLLFVDTSCPFSAIALRDMPTVSKSLAGQNVNAVVLNNGDAQSTVRDFYARNDPGVPVIYDVGAATREHWNVHSVPIVVYIAPAGKIGYQGEAVCADMGSAIETSLKLTPGAIKFTAAGTGFG
jgi:hypothetical protein